MIEKLEKHEDKKNTTQGYTKTGEQGDGKQENCRTGQPKEKKSGIVGCR